MTTSLTTITRIPLPREIAEEISSYNYDESLRIGAELPGDSLDIGLDHPTLLKVMWLKYRGNQT